MFIGVCLCSPRFLKTRKLFTRVCIHICLTRALKNPYQNQSSYIHKLIRLNSAFGSMVNVHLFEN